MFGMPNFQVYLLHLFSVPQQVREEREPSPAVSDGEIEEEVVVARYFPASTFADCLRVVLVIFLQKPPQTRQSVAMMSN
jgi:hypothetical protein